MHNNKSNRIVKDNTKDMQWLCDTKLHILKYIYISQPFGRLCPFSLHTLSKLHRQSSYLWFSPSQINTVGLFSTISTWTSVQPHSKINAPKDKHLHRNPPNQQEYRWGQVVRGNRNSAKWATPTPMLTWVEEFPTPHSISPPVLGCRGPCSYQ